MSRSPPYGQVLILPDHNLEACKRRCCHTSPLTQLEADHGGYSILEAEIMGGQGLITGSSATVFIVPTHQGISNIKINRILWESKGNYRVSQYSTTVTFSYIIVPSSFLFK